MQSILCFGDSITFGTGKNSGWVGKLKKSIEKEGGHTAVFNLGICGEDSSRLLKRFDVEAEARTKLLWPSDKHVILIAIGMNDSKWRGMPEENNPTITQSEFKKNINRLIKKAININKTKVALIGITPVNENLTLPYEDTSFKNERVLEFNNIIKECAEDNGIAFLDMFELMSKENYNEYHDDGLHINLKGYDFMYKIINDFLDKNNLLD